MLEVNNLKIEVSKGDTGTLTLQFTGEDVPPNDTQALFTVRKNIDSEEKLIEKMLEIADGECVVPLTVADTNFPYGRYWWDVRLIYDTGDIYTPMKPAEFRIVQVVGDPSQAEPEGGGADG